MSKQAWRTLVKGVKQTTTYPGYEYEYFNSAEEFEQYMINEIGAAWRDEEWAKVFFGEVQPQQSFAEPSAKLIPDSQAGVDKVTNAFTHNKNNYAYVVRGLVRKGVYDIKTICDIINKTTAQYPGGVSHTFRASRKTVQELVTKYRAQFADKAPRFIERDLAKFYERQGLSLREIVRAMSSDGIERSHEHVRNLLR